MIKTVRRQAIERISEAVRPGDRVLVLGASGWFGRTLLEMLSASEGVPVVAVASRARVLDSVGVVSWSEHVVADFAPTVVVNFAFLTKDKWARDSDAQYRLLNESLTAQLLWSSGLPSVRAALTVSSGAAVGAQDRVGSNPYGVLKLAEEERFLALERTGRSVVVARAWSVTGPLVRDPERYLFSDLILQARRGSVAVRANHPVWRRYVGVDDYLAVCLSQVLSGVSGVVESGGPLVEARDLASRIAGRFGASLEVSDVWDESRSDRYYSDNRAWSAAVAAAGYVPASLDEQIEMVAEYLPESFSD